MCRDRFVSACVPLISWETLRNSALIFNLKPDLPTVSLLEQNVEMGCSHGVPIQVGFISKAWTVTAFHCVHMPAHNSPGFLSSNGTCGAKARFTVLSPMVAWADPGSSRRPRACVVAGPATARRGGQRRRGPRSHSRIHVAFILLHLVQKRLYSGQSCFAVSLQQEQGREP